MNIAKYFIFIVSLQLLVFKGESKAAKKAKATKAPGKKAPTKKTKATKAPVKAPAKKTKATKATKPPVKAPAKKGNGKATEAPTKAPTKAPVKTTKKKGAPAPVTPSDTPSSSSSYNPTKTPTDVLSSSPTDVLSLSPTDVLSLSPTDVLSLSPTDVLSSSPTDVLSSSPTDVLSLSPTESLVPSTSPTFKDSIESQETVYYIREPVSIDFKFVNPQLNGWVGIYDCTNDQLMDWLYVCGCFDAANTCCTEATSSGTLAFSDLYVDCYVASLVDGNDVVLLSSKTFNVAPDPDTTISVDKTDYITRETVVISYENEQPRDGDYVGIYECGDLDTYVDYFENVANSGTSSIKTLEPGCYVAYLSGNVGGNVETDLAKSNEFNIVNDPNSYVSIEREDYTAGSSIEASFANTFPNDKDWVGVFKCDDLETAIKWSLTSSLTNGIFSFDLGAPACYKVFLLDENDYPIVSSEEFSVCNVEFKSVAEQYYAGSEVAEIMFDYCDVLPNDYIVIYLCDGTYITWEYTDGLNADTPSPDSGTVSFATSTTAEAEEYDLTPGCYYAELVNGNDLVIKESVEFNVV